MPKRPDRAQVRIDAFLSPRGGIASTSGGSFGSGHRTSRDRAFDGSSFVNCPVCDARVALRLMNDHMDGPTCGIGVGTRDETPRASVADQEPAATGEKLPDQKTTTGELDGDDDDDDDDTKPSALAELMRASAMAPTRLPGHHLIPDFITPDEESRLIEYLDRDESDTNPWRPSNFNGKHRGKKWGVEVDLKRRTVTPERRPLPALVRAVADRMPAAHPALRGFVPNEANAIDYDRRGGAELLPHVDDRQMSTDLIVNLSLAGDCVMTYVEDAARDGRRGGWEGVPAGARRVDVFLPRRSLQVQSGPCRFNFAHSIRNENLRAPRRVSITFRRSQTPRTRTRVRGE